MIKVTKTIVYSFLSVFCCVLISFEAIAMDLTQARLLEVSSSEKSLILEVGNLDNFEEGVLASIYLQKGPKESPKVFLVAQAEVVKSFPKKSYWLVKKVFISKAFERNSLVYLHSINQVTSGRPLKLKNLHIVASENQYRNLDEYQDKNKDNIPDRFIKEGNNFVATPDLFDSSEVKDETPDSDVLVTTFENFKTTGKEQFSEVYGDFTGEKITIGKREVDLGDIKNAEDRILFESMSKGYVQKVNGMKYGVKSYYRLHQKTEGAMDLAAGGVIPNVYDETREKERKEQEISPRVLAKVKRDGELWSADMNDDDLRRYFVQTGLERETRRRELVMNELEGHEIILHYSGSMVSHGNSVDPNYQGKGYNLGISYDLHLSRTSQELKNWSLQFLFESGISDYDLGVFNARSREYFYGAYLNYYFINNPLTLNSFIYLFGVGLKNGTASVASADISKEYSYQVLTLPALQLMTKYRFRTGDLVEETANVGASLNFALNLDVKNLSVLDRLEDDINSKFSVKDLKYTLGLSVYF